MSVHIIIDGYNLIRQSDVFSRLDRQDLQTGRDALINALAAYKRVKPHKITVVFDGANGPTDVGHRNRQQGIDIRFSNQGESADNLIKRMARHERERALVVSSDQEIVHFVASQGSATISSTQFEEKISMAAFGEDKDMDGGAHDGWIPTTKKRGPSRRLSKKQRRNRIKIEKL